jgi:hypothetical protein
MDDSKYLWIAGAVGWCVIIVMIVGLDHAFNRGLDLLARVAGKKNQEPRI